MLTKRVSWAKNGKSGLGEVLVEWPRVAVILLNWNGYELTKACVDSLLEATYPNSEVFVVDNGSVDGSPARLKQAFPFLTLIENGENLGFARGCNVGIRAAVETGADYVLLLNNDSVVSPGFLEPLVKYALSTPRTGLVSGKILLQSDRNTIWFAGGRVFRLYGARVRGHLAVDNGSFDRCERSGACTGAMMLIPRHVLEQVGLLPEEYFFGMEEWDYSLTVSRAGFDLLYCGESVVFHHSDGSHQNLSPKFLYCGHRNRLVFLTRFNGRFVTRLFVALYTAYVSTIAGLRLNLNSAEAGRLRGAWYAAVRDHFNSPELRIEGRDLDAFEREESRRIPAKRSAPPSS